MVVIPAVTNQDLWVVLGVAGAAGAAVIALARREYLKPGQILGRCADGSVIGLWHGRVRHRAGHGLGPEAPPAGPAAGAGVSPEEAANEEFANGDLCYARVRPGRVGEAAWVVEGLSDEPDPGWFGWEFEGEDDARRVLGVLEQRVVRTPPDPEPIAAVVREADLEAARRSRGDDTTSTDS